MKILLQSTLFYPSVGGIETVSLCLAENYVNSGHECTVLTRSLNTERDNFPYAVSRNPGLAEKISLIRSHDLVHCNGASLELVWIAKILMKPIVWTHAGYQLISIDGLGWYEGQPSPLHPFDSFKFHKKQKGILKASAEFAKLLVRRAAIPLITRHVAITQWVNQRQPLPGQVVIYNPFPLNSFASAVSESKEYEYDFFFLGRLVSEKGAATLIKAFKEFLKQNPAYSKKLLLIGGGNWEPKLYQLCSELHIESQVIFAGKQTGKDLIDWVRKGKIAIIPSEWEEPMGGVAIEMLAAGKLVIVSANGGLAECVGNAGLTFPNGDYESLSEKMNLLLKDKHLQDELRSRTAAQLVQFNENGIIKQYISLFEKVLNE